MKKTHKNGFHLNNDVVTEILLRSPFASLLRLRSVCKSWRDLIDSEPFRKSHIHHHANAADANDDDDEKLLVLFSFQEEGVSELSMLSRNYGNVYNKFPPASRDLLDNHLKLFPDRPDAEGPRRPLIAGPANGLVCVYERDSAEPIAVCNPSLGLITILPSPFGHFDAIPTFWPIPVPHQTLCRDVGIWFDRAARDYVVVQFLSCSHEKSPDNVFHLHASVYSNATNSWRPVAGGGEGVSVLDPIKSSCKRGGSFSHWLALDKDGEKVILSFDFRSEGFRVLEIADSGIFRDTKIDVEIFEEGDDSFLVFISAAKGKESMRFDLCRMRVKEDRMEWGFLSSFGPFDSLIPMALCERGCVVLQSKNGYLVVYDYRCDEDYIEYFEMKSGDELEILEYRGSFVLP